LDREYAILGKDVKSMSFETRYSCADSPLASALFKINGVKSILLSPSTVTITKSSQFDWQVLKPSVELVLSQFIDSGIPVVRPGIVQTSIPTDDSRKDTDTETKIRTLISERVQPFVAQDGGDIDFISFDEDSGVVKVRMHGSCKGCPKSTITLKMGIERMLKHYVPEVVGVIDEGSSETSKDLTDDEKTFGP
jgi:Fe-S cluster biogenesis protein NfuA